MKAKEYSFRDIYHKICYIELEDDKLKKFAEEFPNRAEATGILGYGYIDHQAGLTFELLARAKKNIDGSIVGFEGNDKVTFKYRFGSIAECPLMVLEESSFISQYVDKIDMVNDGYKVNEAVAMTREINLIDVCRSPEFPDDVLVVLFKKGNQPEGCWVRCESIGENCLKGVLLNEPNANFNIHAGEIIDFGLVNNENGIMCISICE